MENNFTETTTSSFPWEEIKKFIRETNDMSDASFNTWIAPLEYEFKENELQLKVPSHAMIGYIQTKYGILLEKAIYEMTGNAYTIKYVTSNSTSALLSPICKCGTTMTSYDGAFWYRCPSCLTLARKCHDGSWKSTSDMMARIKKSYSSLPIESCFTDMQTNRISRHSINSVRLNDEFIFAIYNLISKLEETENNYNVLHSRVRYLEKKIKLLVQHKGGSSCN